ncbi:MAG: helix-turn-helix domain-containing protein [Rhodobacteraceae bacterium]|nr:helix-turn-helix domain-containing protein [Paracoccaceae bacterium]
MPGKTRHRPGDHATLEACLLNYLTHMENKVPIRAIARAVGCHPSTILRRIRRIEARRDDPVWDRALGRAEVAWRSSCNVSVIRTIIQKDGPMDPINHGAFTHGTPVGSPKPPLRGADAKARAPRPEAAALASALPEATAAALRIALRRLAESGAVLAAAPDLERAVILRSRGDAPPVRTAVVEATVVQALVMRDWVRRRRSGRVTQYALSDAGRAALRRLLAEEEEAAAPQEAFAGQHRHWGAREVAETDATGATRLRRLRANMAESPLTLLARRRDAGGRRFLSPEQVQAGERLREDFELAQMGPRVAQNWERFLTAGTSAPGRESRMHEGARAARERVAEALRELGPGLGDIALRCCCHLEGLEAAEQRMGWSARSGKIVLRIALERLRRHYERVHGTLSPMIG